MICVKVLGKGCHLSGPNIGLHLKTQKLSGSTSMITSVLTGTDVVTIDDKVYSWLEYLFIRWAWKCLYIFKGILLFKDTCTLNFVEINVSLQLFPLHLRRQTSQRMNQSHLETLMMMMMMKVGLRILPHLNTKCPPRYVYRNALILVCQIFSINPVFVFVITVFLGELVTKDFVP